MKPCIVVTGMGRCGTSLTMQMLEAAGVPCVGPWPAYETDASSMGGFDPVSFARRSEVAIKLIDPANLPIRDMPNHIVLWLDREAREQAKSQIKFVSLFMPVPNRRQASKAIEADLKRSRERHRAAVGIPGGCPAISLSFEKIIANPIKNTTAICDFLAENGWLLSPELMALEVRQRTSACLPGFLEAELIESRPSPTGSVRMEK